jgi:cation diffusion facilitator CzcD-associated flavoprotein CzcO
MTLTQDNHTTVEMRIANFSNLEITLNHSLNLRPKDVPAVINEIRRYADLPYGYLFAPDQIGFVNELMIELKKIRSACFPYALFLIDGAGSNTSDLQSTDTDVDVISIDGQNPQHAEKTIADYAQKRFVFDRDQLKISADKLLPEKVDVVVVGAGVTGLYAASRLSKSDISVLVVDQSDVIGGIWSNYANATSQVNTSEGGYRLIEKEFRSNLDHSPTREILEDIAHLGRGVSENIYLKSRVDRIEKADDAYRLTISNDNGQTYVNSKGVVLAINDRVGEPRTIDWPDRNIFQGDILSGISDDAMGFDWKNKKVVIVGMGAFAIENTRTALVGGARHVTVVGRRHGTVCPKIIDYLNFSTPYDASFKHDKKSNMRNMLLWKKLYDQSGATHPECWPAKIKHDGHTISVSDIWFIGHYLNKIETIAGSISGMTENGVLVEDQRLIEADVVVNCVGFHRNASSVSKISNYKEMYTNNYVDRDFMYLADAYIDDDAFNSFFGSSVLEMVKFYMDVFIRFFDNDDYFSMIRSDGIESISIEDRKWSHYIAGAAALMNRYPDIYKNARHQVSERTNNFIEAHDLETYIAANKREWVDLHFYLAGKPMNPEDCLPYVFQKLIDKKI